ncbi:ATP-binding cassette domain-containing protein [Teichococcus aestuarii]|uniref:ATP-binding cassette domain-containing protein n=1 Tax=Teichococcus aestuarii TaxID=568898 RepID=UPI00361D7305
MSRRWTGCICAPWCRAPPPSRWCWRWRCCWAPPSRRWPPSWRCRWRWPCCCRRCWPPAPPAPPAAWPRPRADCAPPRWTRCWGWRTRWPPMPSRAPPPGSTRPAAPWPPRRTGSPAVPPGAAPRAACWPRRRCSARWAMAGGWPRRGGRHHHRPVPGAGGGRGSRRPAARRHRARRRRRQRPPAFRGRRYAAPVAEPEHPAEAPSGHALRAEGVRFAWAPDRAPVFEDLSFDLPEGGRLALLGPSGAGKSTLASLLLKLAAPQEGRLLLGGTDIATLSADTVRARIACLTQDARLFDDSIAANLRLAAPEADDAALWRALERAGVADVVRALPEGLETRCGEGGARFSGGQGRRLALARALLAPADILILDEPAPGWTPPPSAPSWRRWRAPRRAAASSSSRTG